MSLRAFCAALALVAATAATLLWMGRAPIRECGTVKLWHGAVVSSENSQHLSDWYTPSHILYGLIFYAFLWLILRSASRRATLGTRLVIATAIEAAWSWQRTPMR